MGVGGTGGLLRGATLLQASGNGVSPGLGKETTTPGSQSREGADKGRWALAAPKAGGGQNGKEAWPPQLPGACGGGLCPRHPPPSGPDVVTAAAARQSHPPVSVGRPGLPAQVGAVDNARRAPQLQDPGTGSGSGAAQGRSPDPRGRHDGLLAAPQRGQSPPPAPPPDDVRCAPRVGTGTLPTPLSETLRRLSALVPLPSRAWPRTTC